MSGFPSPTDRARTIVIAAAVGLATAGGFYSTVRAQATRTVWDGVYADEQAMRGAVLYDRLPGLRIADVVASLRLKPGDVVADIGAGTGAYAIPFAKAVAPWGTALAVDIHQDLLDYIEVKAKQETAYTLRTILARLDDPNLPTKHVDVAFFHDVFHNVNDRQAYLKMLASYLKPNGRIAIIEQEFDDPIAQKWDRPEDRITRAQVNAWMADVGFQLTDEFDLFQGNNNPKGAGMPERWFVVYARDPTSSR